MTYFLTGNLYLWPPSLISSTPQLWLLVDTSLFSVSLGLVFVLLHFSDSTFKWGHVVFVFLWPISLSIMSSGSTHVVANSEIAFSVAEYIPLCVCGSVCVCVCVCISHLYPFIHLWMDNASFHILAIVNNAAMDTRAHILFQVVLNFLWMDT